MLHSSDITEKIKGRGKVFVNIVYLRKLRQCVRINIFRLCAVIQETKVLLFVYVLSLRSLKCYILHSDWYSAWNLRFYLLRFQIHNLYTRQMLFITFCYLVVPVKIFTTTIRFGEYSNWGSMGVSVFCLCIDLGKDRKGYCRIASLWLLFPIEIALYLSYNFTHTSLLYLRINDSSFANLFVYSPFSELS